MKDFSIHLPVKINGQSAQLVYKNKCLLILNGLIAYQLYIPVRLLNVLIGAIMLICFLLMGVLSVDNQRIAVEENSIGSFLPNSADDEFSDTEHDPLMELWNGGLVKSSRKHYKETFLIKKHLHVTKALIDHAVVRVDQLPLETVLELNKEVARLFTDHVLSELNLPEHVRAFFTYSSHIAVIETALMEQVKYHVPASITLAQAALETAYGTKVVGNNYFGIKAKGYKGKEFITTEFYSEKEFIRNRKKVISFQLIHSGGNERTYKCKIKDSFASYETPWKSFRAHSEYLANEKRYAPLFTHGKDYTAWADKIGSTKTGGVGYATSPDYGRLLRKIIEAYSLDLLDT